MLTGSIIFILVLSVIAFSYYIRNSYIRYDRVETLKENIVGYRAKIKLAMDYFRENSEYHFYNDLKLNLDFCLKIILNKGQEEQLMYLKELYKTLYETGYRLKTKIDITYILAPIKSLRTRLFESQMSYIKENTPEGL